MPLDSFCLKSDKKITIKRNNNFQVPGQPVLHYYRDHERDRTWQLRLAKARTEQRRIKFNIETGFTLNSYSLI